jgi:hypothetical protein
MNPFPNFGPPQPYPSQGFLGALKALSTKAKLLITGAVAVVGAVVIAALAALVLGTPSPDVPRPIGPEPCVFVIPIATPGHWMCPEGVSPPKETP